MTTYLEFEAPVAALETTAAKAEAEGNAAEAAALRERAQRQLKDLYARLTPWQRTQVARHPARPHIPHYIAGLFTE
ncbi:MAG: acetyl-CoA carboxylase carboxyl transferase subunit alpha, partial [Sphingomonadaceae bacterium]